MDTPTMHVNRPTNSLHYASSPFIHDAVSSRHFIQQPSSTVIPSGRSQGYKQYQAPHPPPPLPPPLLFAEPSPSLEPHFSLSSKTMTDRTATVRPLSAVYHMSDANIRARNSLDFSQVEPSRDSYIEQWVEHTTRFSLASSCTDVSSSSNSSAAFQQDREPTKLTAEERLLLVNIYSTYRTNNWVSEGVVNLYTSVGRHPPLAWSLRFTGVPILLLDLGGSRSRSRGVRLVLAERGSGLALWYDTLDNLSAYAAQDQLFHIFHCSKDHSIRVGLGWNENRAAQSFLHSVLSVLSRPENIGLSGPKTPRGSTARPVSWLVTDTSAKALSYRTKGSSSGAKRAISKTDISSPVGFCHNVSLTIDNLPGHFAIPPSEKSSLHERDR